LDSIGRRSCNTTSPIQIFEPKSSARHGQAGDLRRQLAAELHDRAGWHLSALNYGICAVETDPENREAFTELRRRFEALAASLREITIDIRHGTAEHDDLLDCLSDLCANWTTVSKIASVLRSEPTSVHLTANATATVASLVREALTNVAKHARSASRVEITLSRSEDNNLLVTVSDDGRGLDPMLVGGAERAGHFGISGMKERLERIGGHLGIGPGKKQGTVLVFELPAECIR
jgi:signal transduction histidine kinase